MNEHDQRETGIFISAIRRQKGSLYGVYSGGERIAEIDAETLAAEDALAAGSCIGEDELERIVYESQCRRARVKALGIVARKEISSAALRSKLEDSGFGSEAAQYAAESLIEAGLVNDERCARMMAEDIYHLRHFARRRCAYELTAKGIERGLAESVAKELEPDPQEAVYDLLTGKLARDMDSEAGIRRSMNTLMRYGFEPSDIRAVLSRLREELDEDQP